MFSVQEINDFATLGRWEAEWERLHALTPGASYFQSYDWFVARVSDAPNEIRPRVFLLHDSANTLGAGTARLAAIVPMIVVTHRRRLASFKSLCYPLSDWGTTYGPLGSEPEAALTAALAHVRRTPRDWDVLDLSWVDRDHTDHGVTARALARAGLAARETLHATAAQVELSGSWNDYWMSRKSHWRTNVRRSEKRLAAQGEVCHIRYRPGGTAAGDDNPRWDLFETCVELASRSWQSQSGSGTTMSHASVQPLLRSVHAAAVRHGAVDLNLLTIGGQAVAFAYNYHYRGHVFGLRMGFDRQASNDGAGSVLLCRAIEDSFRRGDTVYDLGSDYLECKRQWWTRLVPTYTYTHFPRYAPWAQGVRLGRWWKNKVKREK